MYEKNIPQRTSIEKNETVEGEPMETKIRRIVTSKEKITDGAPLVYTDKKEGVMPGYNVRTDRFDIALDAIDKVQRSALAKVKEMNISETETIDGTDVDSSESNK